eukprot:3125857-Amphidinium_carterae.1
MRSVLSKAELYDFHEWLEHAKPASPGLHKSHLHYESSCRACEIEVEPNDDDWEKLLACFSADLRKQGSRGLRVTESIEHLGLKVNDRFEPSPLCWDWALLYRPQGERPTKF